MFCSKTIVPSPLALRALALYLVRRILKIKGLDADIEQVLNSLPIRFETVDIMKQHFGRNTFDYLYSRSALEHFIPIEGALNEMTRIVRPEGLMYHKIDPFYWHRGCHRGALTDIPWAHARLSLEDFLKFTTEYEGKKKGQRRLGQTSWVRRRQH